MIFYFSGSGNSYGVAKRIAQSIEGEQIFPLVKFKDFEQCDVFERIGFVFPCYCGNAPDIVLDFKKRILSHVDNDNKYVFAVITYAHYPAGAYLDFKEDLDGWFMVKMPECDIYNASAPTPTKEKILLDQSLIKIDSFAKDIYDKKTISMYRQIPGMGIISKQSKKHLMYKDFNKKLYTDEKCIKCKQCVRFCPVQNITFDKQPIWGSQCVSCFGCVNRCPQDAIQVGKKTSGKKRYVHPDYKNIYY